MCRVCAENLHTQLTCRVTDLYDLCNEEVKELVHGVMNLDDDDEDEDDDDDDDEDDDEDEENLRVLGQTANTSF